MAFDEALAARIRAAIADRPGTTERRMFGGIAFMVHGNLCARVVADSLMVRVGPEAYDNVLARPYAREMDFSGRPMRGMVFVDGPGVATDADLAQWLGRGLGFVATLPPKG